MLLCRFKENNGNQSFGVIEDHKIYSGLGDPFSGNVLKGELAGSLEHMTLAPPVKPSKIICVGRNYIEHAKERGAEVPKEPLLFMKPPSAIIGSEEEIILSPDMGRVEHEAELAVVIGVGGRYIAQSDAFHHVLGYTCANDVSARDYQAKDGQWTRAKGFDTFCPLGPWINTTLDINALQVSCSVNGDQRQNGTTADMIFNVPFLIEYISRIMTLHPGDVILTGTPAGVSPIQNGDLVEVAVQGIGTLRNSVRQSDHP